MTAAPITKSPILLPDTSRVGDDGYLNIGGVSSRDVIGEIGTAAIVYCRKTLVARCDEAVAAFPDGVAYASKAWPTRFMDNLAAERGMRVDVASGGEMHTALTAGVDPRRLVFHGNNKLDSELAAAIKAGVGLIVIDNFDEIDQIAALQPRRPVDCLIRVTPSVDAHVHEKDATGGRFSKFGILLEGGYAQKAIDLMRSPSMSRYFNVKGAHVHVGSGTSDPDDYAKAVERLRDFVVKNQLREFCIGGGLGIAYVAGQRRPPTITEWAAGTRQSLRHFEFPSWVALTAEPGRSVVGIAGLVCYTIGKVKFLPDHIPYLAVDGGMSDFPRTTLYDAKYSCFDLARPEAMLTEEVSLVGRNCESGDVLIKNGWLPAGFGRGMFVGIPGGGAYHWSMASTYNKLPIPPCVVVSDGDIELATRRQTYAEMDHLDEGPKVELSAGLFL